MAELLSKYEIGAGLVVRNAWRHSEAMQITDMNVLLHHIADTLDFAFDNPKRMKVGTRRTIVELAMR